MTNDIYSDREREARNRIDGLRNGLEIRLRDLPESKNHPDLAIYATGSLARLEATTHSDLDAFFMLSSEEEKMPIGRIRDVKILNAVLEAADEGNFPDFSNDGEYLKFLHIDDVIRNIGSRSDDYKNCLTARMLMLLESSWIYNEDRFLAFQQSLIGVYFNDYHDHSMDFRPIFLLNDVLRFWRNLCLNYENSRNWRESEDDMKRAKGHLDNLKLKFSRLNICFSFIAHLLSQGAHLSAENAMITARMTPIERLRQVGDNNTDLRSHISEMLDLYAWFLETTNRPKYDMLEWISIENNRSLAFNKAATFIDRTGNLVKDIAEKNGYLRYLIV